MHISQEVTVWSAAPEFHEEMRVRRADWRRIREDLEAIRPRREWLQVVASVLSAIAVAAVVGGLAEAESRGAHAGLSWAWLQTAYFTTAALTALFAVLCWFIDASDRRQHTNDVKAIARRMREIEAFFPQADAATSAKPVTGLVVDFAWYGVGAEGKEVTEDCRSFIEDGRLDVMACNQVFGDPVVNKFKFLTVKYSVNGVSDTAVIDEDTMCSLP